MKKALLVGLVALGLVACQTPITKRVACDHAQAVYQGYKAAIEAGLVQDEKAVAAARVAAAVLESYCGWWGPQARGMSGAPILDKNGVRVVWPPAGTER